MIKKIMLLIFISLMILSIAGCSIEGLINKMTDGKVNIDEDNISIEDEDSNMVIGDKVKWNKDKMYGLEAPKAKLTMYTSTSEGTSYAFEDMKDTDIDQYINKIIDLGFTYNVYAVEGATYVASDKDGKILSFMYSKESGSGQAAATKGEKPSDEDKSGVVIGENTKWDKDKMYGLSEPDAKLTMFMSTSDGTSYSFSEMSETSINGFIDEIVDLGFTYNSITTGNGYTGTNEEGFILSLIYDVETGEGSISATKGEIPEEDDNDVVIGDDAKWDSDLVGGVPDPGVKLNTYAVNGNDIIYSFEIMEDPTAYINKIKDCGFTEDTVDLSEDDYIFYSASNSEGDSVAFVMNDEGCAFTYTKN